MNNSTPIPENKRHTGRFDAFVLPDDEPGTFEVDLTLLDDALPHFEITAPMPIEPSRKQQPAAEEEPVSFELLAAAPPLGVSPVSTDARQTPPLTQATPAGQVPPQDEISLPLMPQEHTPHHEEAAPAPQQKFYTDPPEAADLDTALLNLVRTTPLLSEDELLDSLADPRHGRYIISPKTLKQALLRTNLDTDYKRYRAYITG